MDRRDFIAEGVAAFAALKGRANRDGGFGELSHARITAALMWGRYHLDKIRVPGA